MPQSTEEFKTKFNNKLSEILEQKRSSSIHLSKDKYKCIINRLGEIAEAEKQITRLPPAKQIGDS